ncbi:DUF3284 domain-containing protein [Lacticaseibacillus hegangensis]|uniref:DUF3284 domain-containing protein n=1 Tax=Lacticaseibacillus hegangensis TaxID=2486010 RepID=A0ABW4CZU6_9LACO|nr:DUF3284 domain-containing protein [Lacticaseibacillus hegangensis]
MALKPMTFNITLNTKTPLLYETIYKEQLKYFQHFDPTIDELHPGVAVAAEMLTKVQKEGVPTNVEVTDLEPDRTFETRVSYSQGDIVMRYALQPAGDQTKVFYSEQNSFNKANMMTNFWLVSWFYTFMYKHNLKKRMKTIEQIANAAQ